MGKVGAGKGHYRHISLSYILALKNHNTEYKNLSYLDNVKTSSKHVFFKGVHPTSRLQYLTAVSCNDDKFFIIVQLYLQSWCYSF